MQLSTSAVGVIAIVSVMISAMTETEHGINHPSRPGGPERGARFANSSSPEGPAKSDGTTRVFSSTSSIVVEKSSTESLTILERLVENRDQSQLGVRKVKSEMNVAEEQPTRHVKNELERQEAGKEAMQSGHSFNGLSRENVIVTSYDPLEEMTASWDNSAHSDSQTKTFEQNINSFKERIGWYDELREPFTSSAKTEKENIDSEGNSESLDVQVSRITGLTSTTTDIDVLLDEQPVQSQTSKGNARKSPTSRTWNELGSGKISGSIYSRKELGGRIVQPNITSALGKYAPYFEDGDQPQNVTARVGTTVKLNCRIGMLTNKTVTWNYHGADEIRLLTVGRHVFSLDQRINLLFQYPTNWGLQIQYASPRDSGLYECQVATFPPRIKKFYVLITAPILTIMDDSGRIVSGERHLKAGSALRLKCEVKDVHNESVLWTRGDETLTEDISENRTTDILEGREVQVVVSTLVVERATSKHAGNYSCVVPEKAKITVAVHVLNGELPAAVHDVNGVSRSVLNLWLIHLTVSYVFSR